ncbi:hypothetical protein DFQ27_007364 [Actinomortierella ambigua]|uniref:RING-type domain-containing protein n=1 Tax=Actinomortierella ambigua TaxID=1343610 RepID=A0A9P6PWE3_9FUNG|nr:hypothetical protein DFQ27_007364 [Actinomortierella ambigua]
MASYFEDRSLEDPIHSRTKQQQGSHRAVLNPDLSAFMPVEETEDRSNRGPSSSPHTSDNFNRPPSPGDFRRLAEMFGAFRAREDAVGDEVHQEFLDNLITQLMDEAGASGKTGPPPAAKSFIRDLPIVHLRDVKREEACVVCNEHFHESSDQLSITRLPCKHAFDRDCIVPWLELHNNCPACRAEVPSDDPDWIRKKREAELAKYAAEAEMDQDWMYS